MPTTEPFPADPGASLPATLGRYDVLGYLASGGMAEILLGRLKGPRGFEKAVVLKRVLPHLTRQHGFAEMFLDEARIIAQIRHPNVVQVQELAQAGSELFLVMEYLEGETVSTLIRRSITQKAELPTHLIAFVIAEALAGLHAAHEVKDNEGRPLNLVHRDVSPQNIIVTYGGDVKVLDFGVAKVEDRVARTRTGEIKGKVDYMSPEQCVGNPLDRRSDIFSVGTVLFEMLAARRLFRRPTEVATMRAVTEERIPLLSSVAPHRPAEAEAICARALSRSPQARYPTARDMRVELEALARRHSGETPLQEQLAQAMQQLFADRIAEKAELLRKVRSGSKVTVIPQSEPERSTDLPVLPLPAPGADDTRAGLQLLGPRRYGVLVAIGFLMVVAGIALALGLKPRPPPVVVALPAPVAAPGPAPAPAAAPPPAPVPPPSMVSIRVETVPPGATVIAGGEVRGQSPLTLELARSKAPVALELRKDGYAVYRETVTPTESQKLKLALKAKGGDRPASRSKSGKKDDPLNTQW